MSMTTDIINVLSNYIPNLDKVSVLSSSSNGNRLFVYISDPEAVIVLYLSNKSIKALAANSKMEVLNVVENAKAYLSKIHDGVATKITDVDNNAAQASIATLKPSSKFHIIDQPNNEGTLGDILAKALSGDVAKPSQTQKLIRLADATEVGQKVAGTGSDSVYVCIFVSKDFNIAARYIGSGLSIRFEGPKHSKIADFISASKQSSNHSSIHLNVKETHLQAAIATIIGFAGGETIPASNLITSGVS